MVTDAVSFGRILRRRRKELGYTQAFVAEISGLSVSFISDLENGKSTAELDKSIRLAPAYDIVSTAIYEQSTRELSFI